VAVALVGLTSGRSAELQPKPVDVRLEMLGTFDLYLGGRTVALPISAQRLLALLALRERPARRSWLAGTLWPDKGEERAAANLRSTLWRLRRPCIDLVVATGDRLQLDDSIDVDLHRVREVAWAIMRDGAVDRTAVPEVLLVGDLLPEWYDDWVLLEQERTRQLRMHALEELCHDLATMGRSAAAVEAGLLAVQCDPLRESAQRALITAYLTEGNRSEAVRQFRRYALLLRSELGIDPSAALRDLASDARTP
jgi:DNA-binding SARP family transcriptional activator